MPTSSNEPIQRNSEGEVIQPKPYLASPDSREINRSMGGFESFGSKSSGSTGLSIDQLSNLANIPTNTSSFSSPISAIPRSELIANKRYDSYNRNVDLENIYGLQQSWADQLANGVVKMAGTAVGTFAQSFATIPNTIGAFRSGKLSELSGGTTGGYESSIDTWMKNIEDYFPNYYTRKEKESPYLAMLPFAPGSANFWGDKIIKNLGFTAGAIGGAIVQDLGIAAVTGGLGEIPGVAAQIGKASLWLNKIFTGTNDLEKVLDLASKVGKTEQQILKYSKLAEIAAATKVNNGFRYGMGIYGSSRTEAAIEARDSYRQVREDLIRQYKLDNYNEEPTGEAAKEIENYATDAMNTRFGINMALLTASNTIQFGNLFKSFTSASKGLSGQLTRDLEDIGKLGLKEGSKDIFEKKVAGSIGEKVWESVRPKFANVFTEGVYEEGGQYAAEKGAYDYYTRKYKNLKDPKNKESWNSVNEVVNSTMNGLKEQFGTSEGLENMIVGAISALISGGIMGKVDDMKGQGKDARLQSSINILNKYGLTGILSNTYENTLDSVGIAKGMEAAAKSGNVYDYKNLKHDMFFKFVQSRIPSQMHDVTIEQLNMLRDLDKDEFEKSFGMDFNASNKKTVNEYVDSLVNQANDIKKTYDSIDSTFKNPFKPSINSTTVQDALESNNHAIFENWKTELTQLASIAPDTNSRLESIQNSVFEINPAVSNDLLSTLSDKTSLAELSKMYEEKANQLNKTVTEITSAEDAKRIKQQVKSFRTASEKIQLGITNGLDLKSFEYLLNFELNNYDTTKERVVRPEFVSQLNDYGYDIARLKARKKRASKLFDNLSDEEGFKKFFAEVEKINSQEAPEETTEAAAPIVPEAVVPQFKNKNGDLENIVPNKEYQVPASKTSKVDKIADDRFQVTSPDGNITFYPSKEKADAAAAELNEEFGNLQKVKVVAVNDNGTVKVEDVNGDIYDILASKLEGYERLQTEQEKLQKFSEDVDKSQKEIETKSGVVGTSPLPVDLSALVKEDPKRSLANLFTGTTSVSENDPALLKAHEIRSIALKHNAKSFPNRQALRILLVTQNQEKSLGLDGLANLSMGSIGTHTDIDNGLVAAVYVEQDKDDVYFINENGERIGKLNEPVDITKVVFDSMPTTSLFFRSSKETRYRATDGKEAAEEQSARWREKRQELFENKGKPESYKFTISRGIADVIDTYAKNPVGKTMIDESLISTQEGLVVISVTGTISHQGEDINFPVGRPVFQYGDVLQFLNNKMFTKEEAEALFEVMSLMSKSINEQLASGRKIKIDSDYSTFLQNLLYWRKSPDTSGNQIFVDTETMEFYFGGEGYDITDIASYKDEIVSKLQTVYNNVNNTTLTKSFSEPFVEYYLKDGALETREWDNYQSYLLSSKNPDGSARNVNNIPLTSSVREQNSLKPYNFKSKYAVLEGVELPKVITKPATVAPVAPVVAPTAPVTTVTPTEVVQPAPAVSDEQKVIDFIGKRIQLSLPKGTVSKGPQTYKGIDSGEIIYTVTPEGQVAIDGTNSTNLATIKIVASKPASMAAINAALAPTPAPAQPASAPVVTPPTTPVVEELKMSPYGVIAADYLFTSGVGSVLSTDYFIQALSGAFINAAGLIEQIRQNYVANIGDLGNLKDAIGTDNYKKMIAEIREAINKTYNNNNEIQDIFETVLKYAGGFPSRLGSEISSKLEKLNEQLSTKEVTLTASVAPVVETKTETPASTDAKALTEEEADWLYNNLKQITEKYNSSTLADSVDPNLKTPLKFGETTVTAIEPRAGDKSYIWFERPTGKWLISIDQRDGKQYLVLSKINDKGTYYAQQISEEELQKLIDSSGLRSLIDSIYQDTNVEQPKTRRDQFDVQNALQQKYGLKRTYKDIINELKALEGVKPEETKATAAIEVSKTYWTSSTPESIKEELIADTSKSITSATEDDPGVTVSFAYNQANNETREVFVSGFEDAGEMDVVETLKGNYFSVESPYGSQDYHENDPLLNEEIKLIINQNKKSERPPEPPPPKKTFGKAKNNRKKSDFMKVARVGEENARKLTDLEIQLLKEWHAENVSNIPYEVLEKLVSINATERAYGVYEDGVAKFYKGGLSTSPYHELFHPIWQDFLSQDERQAIMDEFRAKIGSFTERSTGKKIDYSEATDEQIEERIADDFGDFRVGKLPARSLSERILKFFRLIIEFVKQFVRKPSQKEKLFNAINTGKYKGKKLSEKSVKKVVNPSYKQIGALTEQQAFEFVQDIAARWFQIVFETNRSLYDVENLAMGNVFDKIKDIYIEDEILDDSDADSLSTSEFNELVIRTKEFLRTFKIEFTEEDTISINDENRDKNEYAKEAFTTNWKTNSPFAIKLLMGTMTESVSSNGENENLDMPDSKENSFGGYKLLDFSRTFATAIDRFSNTTKATDLINKLVGLAASDNNYVRLFTRLGGSTKTKTIDFSQFKDHDWRLFVNFYQTFTRQKPDAIIQYITDENVYSGPANLFTSIKEVKRSWIENMRALAKDPESLLSYNSDEGTLQINDIKSLPIRSTQDKIDFLAKLGVIFPIEAYGRLQTKEQNNQVKEFGDAVSAIRTFLGSEPDIMTISGKTLTIDAQLNTLAELLIQVTNPNQDTSFFGLDKKRIQAYADNNAISVFENLFNSAKTLDDLLKNIRPELSDIFSANSVVLKKGGLFFDKNGKRIKKLKVQYIQGTNKSSDKKEIVTSKLSIGDRFVQEMNQNINGSYYVLVPADSSTEWMMNLGNIIKFSDIQSGKAASKIYDVFIGYLKDDIAIARDNRTNLKSVEPRAKELRFFKDILPKDVLQKLNNLIAVQDSTDNDFKVFIDENIGKIHASIDSYINFMNDRTIDILRSNNQVILTGVDKKLNDVYSFKNLDDDFSKKEKLNKRKLDKFELNDIVKFTNVNYIINNIEFHKIMFGDPYQFGIKGNQLDETKRIKSFLSPRRTMFDTAEYNTFLNQEYNYVDGIPLTSKDPGYHLYKSYTKTVTLEDVNIVGSIAMLKNIPEEIQKKYKAEAKETDGVSWIMDNTYKEVKLKNGQWSPEAELWHQWQMAYTRQNLPGYEYTNDTLKDKDAALVSKPEPKFVIEVLKPVVTGNRNNTSRIELVLDKFSQMPVYYSMVEGTNLEKLYKKMFDAKVGYGVVLSGRKVGAEETHKIYVEGEFNDAPYTNDTIINVPWTSYGIQVENSYEGEKEQTRGSQITKLASIDLFDNGKGSDRAVQEYAENKKWLQLLHENGYNNLLKKLGIEDLGDSFRLINNVAVSETLEYELLRREMSTNAKDTVQLDKNKNFRIPFEASTAYIQIRDILFSMIDKAILSPKMNGGAHVQVPVTMFENLGDRQFAYNSPNGWVKISKSQYLELSDDEKKKTVLTDTTLKFYTRESPYCEVLLPHWFGEKFKSKFKTEKELLAYLNKPENSSILRGIGFRIPTQSLSSIEVFRVKGFLPKSMGSTVVVPSEIVTKAGSDFDIDKLNMYLKATYIDKNGDLRLVEHKGSEGETLEFYGKVFDDVLAGKKIKKAELFEAVDILTNEFADPKNLLGKYGSLIDVLLEDYQQSEDLAADLMKDLEKLGEADTQAKLKNTFINNMYKKSLENAYYSSLERLVTLPENFDRLISPVDDAGLKKVSEDLDDLTKVDDSSIPNRILDRNYMTSLRHSFIVAKKWVGIAAINITGQSLTQRAGTYIDPAMFDVLSAMDKRFIGDGSIALDHNTTEDGYVSIGGRKTADGTQYISDRLSGYATSFVDVAKDPYIMKIIKSELAVGTFMFLERIGVGETTAIFMNQPIISKYLQYLDSMNMKGLFGKSAIDYIRMEFPTTEEELDNATLDVNDLKLNISTYYEKGYFKDSRDNAVQHLVLSEFLKYAKMAEFSFKLTQATNYDTSKMRSSGDLYRKQLKTEVANKSNIFSSAKKILDTSFIGDQSDRLSKLFEGMGEILKFDSYHFRNVINRVLKPYAMDDYLSGDNYSRIENKIIASFLDYIVQTKSGISSEIDKLMLIDNIDSTTVATRVAEMKIKYPEIGILDRISIQGSPIMEGGAKTVKLTVNNKESYDEDVNIGMFRELRDFNSETNSLYKDIVKLAILQGTYQSAVSIKNVIPIEDYSAIVAPIIAPLIVNADVQAFADGWFQRNNWKDSEVWKTIQPNFFIAKAWDEDAESVLPVGEDVFGNPIYQYLSLFAFPNVAGLNVKSGERKILILNETFNSLDVQEDFVIVPRVVVNKKTGVMVDMVTGKTVTDSMLSSARKKGNQIYKAVYGYQKVKHIDGTPVTYTSDYKGEEIVNHVYKLINLYGDSPLATEYYTDFRRSVLNNNTMKIDSEIPDVNIIDYFAPQIRDQLNKSIVQEAMPSQPIEESTEAMSNDQVSKAYDNAISQLSLEEINAVLKNENKKAGTLEIAQNWAKKEYSWMFDGDDKYVKNFEYSLSPEAIKNNLDISISNYDGNVEAAQLNNQLYQKIARLTLSKEATEAVSGEPRIGEITKNRDGSYNVMLFEGTSSDWKDNVLEVKILPNGKFQIVAFGMRELLKKDLEERFGKSIISKISSLVNQSVNESSEPISDERKAFIENRIRKLEQDIENGVAGPDTYSAIDAYRKELGITPNYEVTAANFESNVPDYTMAISNFYESLTPEQKATLGPIEDVIADYESIPFDSSYEDYIESLKCKL
jgi:hypothetical protein